MKRYLTMILAGAALLALAGCSREPLAEELGTEVLGAEIVSETSTRTSYDGTTGKFAWESGDKIALFLVKEGGMPRTQVTKVTPKTDTSKGSFVYSKETGYTRTGYAVYPATAAKSLSGNNALTLTLPASYDLTASPSTPLPLVAVNSNGETSDLSFKAACGLLRIKCDGLTGTTVTVTLDKGVTGDFAVADPATAPAIAAVAASASHLSTVTFTVSGESATLNLPLPCGDYASVSVTCGSTTKSVDVPFTMVRGQGKKLHVTF